MERDDSLHRIVCFINLSQTLKKKWNHARYGLVILNVKKMNIISFFLNKMFIEVEPTDLVVGVKYIIAVHHDKYCTARFGYHISGLGQHFYNAK